jgi:beta-carotene/zeaxanthin 4-ketolase
VRMSASEVPIAESAACEGSRPAANAVKHGRDTRRGGYRRQSGIGLTLALLVALAWLALHVAAIFYLPLDAAWPLAAPVMAVQCWLYVGIFIVAHDCIHGSLTPLRPKLNHAIGTAALFLYAGFSFERIKLKHHDHHRHSGTGRDPDFDDRHPPGYWRWYWRFFSEYLTWRQPAVFTGAIAFYAVVLGAPIANLILFWAVPALLSSLQLFTFGTYLPHRPDGGGFADHHNARSSNYSWLASLLTCFHFGYHHEHHLHPETPWWRLPRARGGSMARHSRS